MSNKPERTPQVKETDDDREQVVLRIIELQVMCVHRFETLTGLLSGQWLPNRLAVSGIGHLTSFFSETRSHCETFTCADNRTVFQRRHGVCD